MARGYFALQALAVTGWWLALFFHPSWRDAFRPWSAPDAALLAFAPADLLILALGSALVAFSNQSDSRRQRALVWLVVGAMLYGASYTLTLTVMASASPLGAILMCPAAVASVVAAFALDGHVTAISTGSAR